MDFARRAGWFRANALPMVGTRRAVSAAGLGVFFPSPADMARPVPTGVRCRPAPRCAVIHRSRCVWIYRIYGLRPQGGMLPAAR